jgi:hypothetical protein
MALTSINGSICLFFGAPRQESITFSSQILDAGVASNKNVRQYKSILGILRWQEKGETKQKIISASQEIIHILCSPKFHYLSDIILTLHSMTSKFNVENHCGSFKKSFTALKAYINLFWGRAQCFERHIAAKHTDFYMW